MITELGKFLRKLRVDRDETMKELATAMAFSVDKMSLDMKDYDVDEKALMFLLPLRLAELSESDMEQISKVLG